MDNNYLSRLKSLFSESVSNQDYLEELKVSDNVQELLENRYFVNLFNGKENTYKQLCKRVSRVVAATELYHYSQKIDTSFDYIINHDESASELLDYIRRVEYSIYTDMLNGNFLFNSPCLFSAGTGFSATDNGHLLYDDEITLDDYRKIYNNVNNKNQMLFACFVIGIEDSIEGIFESVKKCAIISKSGGGVGLNFSPLREKNAKIRGNEGLASGVVSFAGDFNAMGDSIRQGGKRRVALMGMLNSNHPDIEEFINCKTEEGKLTNFNISVAIDDKFMEAIQSDSDYDLISSADGRVVKTVKARELWNSICESAWKRGDPGIFFVDLANKDSLLKFDEDYQIVATNPSLIAGTKVLTNNGIFNIEELENQEFTVPSLISNSSAAKCFMSGENKHVNKITFKNKFTATATDEHKWVVLRNDELIKVKTSELQVGDYIPKTPFRKTLGFGTLGDRSDGFLIGWLYGDGNITVRSDNGKTQYGFTISNEDFENGICQKIVDKLSSITGNVYNPNKRERDGSVWYEIHTANKTLHEYMLSFGVSDKSNGLPTAIWQTASDEFRIGFIDGIFSSDGYVDSKQCRLMLTNKHDKFISEMQILLGFYGINGSVCSADIKGVFPNKKDYGKLYHRNDLRMSHKNGLLFRELVGYLTQSRKNDNLQSILNLQKISKYSDYIQVSSIEDSGIADKVWDLTVYDDSHSFYLGSVVTSNCGEQPLPNFTSCNLGSINLANFVSNNKFDSIEFAKMVKRGLYYLDLVIDTSSYPLPEIEERTKDIRPVGLGIMGLADLFIRLNIRYGSEKSNELAEYIAQLLAGQSLYESVMLGEIKGSFTAWGKLPQQTLLNTFETEYMLNTPNYENMDNTYFAKVANGRIKTDIPISLINAFYSLSLQNKKQFEETLKKFGEGYLRNSRRESEAPTGSISMILNTSSSLEPNFAFEWKRNITDSNGEVTTRIFKHKYADIENKELLVTANELSPEEHIGIVEAFAPYISSAVSKTCNLSNSATVEDVKKVYENCYNNGIKGITIYRDMSREGQTLQKIDNTEKSNNKTEEKPQITEKSIERPKVISGYTQKGETNYGNLYATLNVVDGKPYELFVNIGKSGSLAKSLSEALSRTISISLQNGINIDEIIKTLNGIADSETPWVFEDYKGNEEWCKSIPDMIAKMMKSLSEYVKEIGAVEQKSSIEVKKDENNIDMNSIIEHDKTSTDKKKILCPECLKNGNSIFLVQMAGCPTCPNCGWSACA